ncbi:MAG: DUF4159 domain-containing protein [Candidatus Obscuribacterales bacterium]|nr:DUF4159 domain-containing protein [Steroidobacteraceae bacterium]
MTPHGVQARRSAYWIVLGALAVMTSRAQVDPSWTEEARKPQAPADLSVFTFTRGAYDSVGGFGDAYYQYDGRVWARWETDYPEGDENFSVRLKQLTRVNVSAKATKRTFDATDLGDFPFLYVADPGWMTLSKAEQAGLRRYLMNGGFVWVDDFWGDGEWQNLAEVMRAVLPAVQWREITTTHPIFHTVFEINEMPQIPALPFASRGGGGTAESPGSHKFPGGSTDTPHLRGWFDESGRLMLVATFNTDLGDGFEREAFGQWYFETFSTKAYMLGTNIVTYALTH